MRPSLLVFVALASEPCPPPGQTAARRRTPVASTSVGGRLSGWRVKLWCQMLRTGEKFFFSGTGAGELQVLLVLFLRCRAHIPPLPAPFSGRCSSSRGCRLRQGPDKDGKFFVVAAFFYHDASLTPCPCPPLPTTFCQRSSSGSHKLLVSRPWYTRDTTSLVRWLQP